MEEIRKDPRFAQIRKDPRFHKLSRKERKVKIDKRFKSMFEDKKFKLKYSVDKRGRPINMTTNENLKRFYDLSDSDSGSLSDCEDDETVQERKCDKSSDRNISKKDSKLKITEIQTNSSKSKEKHPSLNNNRDQVQDFASKKGKHKQTKKVLRGQNKQTKLEEDSSECAGSDEGSHENTGKKSLGVCDGPDIARGEGLVSSSDEESDEDGGDISSDDGFDHGWGELDCDAPVADDASSRLAVCNMDWDRIKAQDLLVLMNSFKPQGGVVKSVKIYPSEFGLKRMKEEELHGPTELVNEESSQIDGAHVKGMTGEETSGSAYHREKLRKYQLNRLKYYYAVVECDSKETANVIYNECDGLEYESSSSHLDLRFIPDDMTFEQEPKSNATEMLSTYQPSVFSTTALNQSKVELTWDETDHDRLKVTMRKFKPDEIDQMNVDAYLASSSDEDEGSDSMNDDGNEAEDDLHKYKALLKGLEEKEAKKEEKDMEMEISWEPGLKETAQDLVKKKVDDKDMTPWEQYLKKKREKKKEKREEKSKKKVRDEDRGIKEAFSDDDVPADVDMNDPYFKEEMEDTSTQVKKKDSKSKKKKQKGVISDEGKQKEAELELLMLDEDDDHHHFNLKDIMEKEKQEKRKKKKKAISATVLEDTFKMDVTDPRFEAMYKSHLYNIDPSAPEFKKTKAMDLIIKEKLKRKKQIPDKDVCSDNGDSSKRKKAKLETLDSSDYLTSLVKSVKMKTQRFKQRKGEEKH